jgi:hypothetical protein
MQRYFLIIFLLFLTMEMRSQSAPAMPLLKLASNKKYFTTSDGRPFFWMGDTGWLLFIKLNNEETLQYLDKRKEQGFNVIQVMVLHDLEKAVNRYGDSALHNGDVSKPFIRTGLNSHDFWKHVDFVIDAAAKRGIYLALVPVWGTNVKNGHVSVAAARSYAKFLGQRYKNRNNIIWLNGGDINGSDSIAVWNEIGDGLKKYDGRHLVGFHPRGRTSSSRWFQSSHWLDFNMFQSGHRNYAQDTSKGETHYGEDNWKYIDEDLAKKPVKPTLDGEPSYEGIPQGLHDTTQPYWNANDVRRYAWWSVLEGGAGFTYGNNAVMQFHQPSDKGSAYGAKEFWYTAINDTGAGQMIYLKNLLLSKPYFERVADPDMIIYNGQHHQRISVAKGKNYAIIYTYTGDKFRLRPGRIAGEELIATWYDPRTGKFSGGQQILNSIQKEFDPPGDPAEGNDWVLLLQTKSEK